MNTAVCFLVFGLDCLSLQLSPARRRTRTCSASVCTYRHTKRRIAMRKRTAGPSAESWSQAATIYRCTEKPSLECRTTTGSSCRTSFKRGGAVRAVGSGAMEHRTLRLRDSSGPRVNRPKLGVEFKIAYLNETEASRSVTSIVIP